MHKGSDLSDHLHKVFRVLWGQTLYLPRTSLKGGSMGHNQHCISCWTTEQQCQHLDQYRLKKKKKTQKTYPDYCTLTEFHVSLGSCD